MKEKQKIGVPLGFWDKDERELFWDIKSKIESSFSEFLVGAFSIQLPFALKEDKLALQIKFSRGIPVFQIQAPIEYENSIVNYGEDLERTLELATRFQKEDGFCVNYHVGITLTNMEAVEKFVKSREKIWDICIENFRKLADQAYKRELVIAIENEPSMFIKPVRPDNTIRPVYFPFGSLVHLQKLVNGINRDNVHLTFDCGHWAVSQLVPSFITKNNLASKFFPDENLTEMLFKSLGCSSWEEYSQSQAELETWLEAAEVYHLSNTTGISAHLSKEEQIFWGADGTFEGYFSREQLRQILEGARKDNKTIILEVEMDLENKTFQEPLDFLKWLKE